MRHGLGVRVFGRKKEGERKRERDEEKGRDVTPQEMEEYQYHASLPSPLESLSSRLFSPASYYRLGKIIFEYRYLST